MLLRVLPPCPSRTPDTISTLVAEHEIEHIVVPVELDEWGRSWCRVLGSAGSGLREGGNKNGGSEGEQGQARQEGEASTAGGPDDRWGGDHGVAMSVARAM